MGALKFLLFGLFTILFVKDVLAEDEYEYALEPEPSAPSPEPNPQPAPPPAPVLSNYIFDALAQSNSIGSRSEAVVGTNSDNTFVYILGGGNQTVSTTSYKFELAKQTWTDLAIPFSRVGACSSQDSSLATIWIYGGGNGESFQAYNIANNDFTNFTNAPAALPTTGVSCVASADGTKFYVLFGEGSPSDNCSNTVGVYNSATKNWTLSSPTGPAARAGANAVLYGSTIVVFGGVCGSDYFNDVSRLDLATMTWTTDPVPTHAPSGRAYASAFVIENSLFIFGGLSSAGSSADTWIYDLVNKNWTLFNTAPNTPGARYSHSTVSLVNRVFFYGGENGQEYWSDAHQFVIENACFTRGCEDCTSSVTGCGWCNDNVGQFRCIAGDVNGPFVNTSCNNSGSSYIVDLDFCPQAFPSYGIALLVIGGVVVVGVIIFAIMKVRSGDDKQGYERIS